MTKELTGKKLPYLIAIGLFAATSIVAGCGSMVRDKQFVISKTDDKSGYHYRITLSAKETHYANVHLMKIGRDQYDFNVYIYSRT